MGSVYLGTEGGVRVLRFAGGPQQLATVVVTTAVDIWVVERWRCEMAAAGEVSVMTMRGQGLSEDLRLLRSGVGGDRGEERLFHLECSGDVAVAQWFGVDALFGDFLQQARTVDER